MNCVKSGGYGGTGAAAAQWRPRDGGRKGYFPTLWPREGGASVARKRKPAGKGGPNTTRGAVRVSQAMKPRFFVVKLLMDGATWVISLSDTPNQRASVAANWSTEVVGR